MKKKKACVLIVEDEAIIAKCLGMDLEREGYSVCRFVATGEEAIESAQKDNPDIIFMDIHLAGKIDGIEAAKKIIKEKNIPILFMTAYAERELKIRAKDINPIGYLIKPIEYEDIKKFIDPLFGNGS